MTGRLDRPRPALDQDQLDIAQAEAKHVVQPNCLWQIALGQIAPATCLLWCLPHRPAYRRIVVAADDYLRARKEQPIYTEALCKALAVSASTLHEAFHAVFGIRPHRFLKFRRLAMVRAVLLAREGRPPLVKSVAPSHGFWHLGQSAADYQATFSDVPSRRSRGRRAGPHRAEPKRRAASGDWRAGIADTRGPHHRRGAVSLEGQTTAALNRCIDAY
jgi:AraC-like DNA-binding protein